MVSHERMQLIAYLGWIDQLIQLLAIEVKMGIYWGSNDSSKPYCDSWVLRLCTEAVSFFPSRLLSLSYSLNFDGFLVWKLKILAMKLKLAVNTCVDDVCIDEAI